jgi:hypothetical protein
MEIQNYLVIKARAPGKPVFLGINQIDFVDNAVSAHFFPTWRKAHNAAMKHKAWTTPARLHVVPVS